MRHVEVDYHYIREKIILKKIDVGYVATTDQVADFLTKGLSFMCFKYLISKLPVRQRPVSLRGRDKPILDNSTNLKDHSTSSLPIQMKSSHCNMQQKSPVSSLTSSLLL